MKAVNAKYVVGVVIAFVVIADFVLIGSSLLKNEQNPEPIETTLLEKVADLLIVGMAEIPTFGNLESQESALVTAVFWSKGKVAAKNVGSVDLNSPAIHEFLISAIGEEADLDNLDALEFSINTYSLPVENLDELDIGEKGLEVAFGREYQLINPATVARSGLSYDEIISEIENSSTLDRSQFDKFNTSVCVEFLVTLESEPAIFEIQRGKVISKLTQIDLNEVQNMLRKSVLWNQQLDSSPEEWAPILNPYNSPKAKVFRPADILFYYRSIIVANQNEQISIDIESLNSRILSDIDKLAVPFNSQLAIGDQRGS